MLVHLQSAVVSVCRCRARASPATRDDGRAASPHHRDAGQNRKRLHPLTSASPSIRRCLRHTWLSANSQKQDAGLGREPTSHPAGPPWVVGFSAAWTRTHCYSWQDVVLRSRCVGDGGVGWKWLGKGTADWLVAMVNGKCAHALINLSGDLRSRRHWPSTRPGAEWSTNHCTHWYKCDSLFDYRDLPEQHAVVYIRTMTNHIPVLTNLTGATVTGSWPLGSNVTALVKLSCKLPCLTTAGIAAEPGRLWLWNRVHGHGKGPWAIFFFLFFFFFLILATQTCRGWIPFRIWEMRMEA